MDLHADLRGWRVAQKRLADEAVIARENARIYAPSRRIHALVEQSNAIQRGRVPITGKETIFFKTDDRLMVETGQDREQPMSREMSGGNGILDMYGWHQGKGVDQLERTIAIQSGISQKYKKVFAKAPEVVPYMGELAEPPESDLPIERALRDLKNNKSPYKPDQDGTFFDWNDRGDGGDGAAIEVEDDGGGAVGEADPNGLGAVGAAAALGGAVGNAVVVLPPQIQQQARDVALAEAAGLGPEEGADAAQQGIEAMVQARQTKLPEVGTMHFDPYTLLEQMRDIEQEDNEEILRMADNAAGAVRDFAGRAVGQAGQLATDFAGRAAGPVRNFAGRAVGQAGQLATDIALAPVRGVRAVGVEAGRVAGEAGRVIGQIAGSAGRAARYLGPIVGRQAGRALGAAANVLAPDYLFADLNGGFQGQEQAANVTPGAPPPPPPGGGGGQIEVGDVTATEAVNQAREAQRERRQADAAAAAQPPAQNAMQVLQRRVAGNNLVGGYEAPRAGAGAARAGAAAPPEPPAADRPSVEVDASLAGLLPRARAGVAAMAPQQQTDLLRRAAAGVAGLARGAYGVAANAVDAAGTALAAAQEEAKQRRLARQKKAEEDRIAQEEEAARIITASARKQTLDKARAVRQTSAFRVAEQDRARQQDAMDARMQQDEEDRVQAAQAASQVAQAAAEARQAAKVEEAKRALAAAEAEARRAALDEGGGASAGPQVPNAAPAARAQRGIPANVPGMQGRQQGVVYAPAGLTLATGARNALGLKRLYERIEGRPLPDRAFDSKGNFIKQDLKQWWILNSTSPDAELNSTFWKTLAQVDNEIDTEKPPKSGKKYRTHNGGMGGQGKPHGSDKRKRAASLSGSENGEESGEVMVKKKRKGRWPAGSQEARDEMARIRAMRKT
jgi:hypothetical protein